MPPRIARAAFAARWHAAAAPDTSSWQNPHGPEAKKQQTRERLGCRGKLAALLCLLALFLAGCAGPSRQATRPAPDFALIDAGQRTEAVLIAMSMLGTRYHYGGGSPQTGFDCSGLVVYVMNAIARQRLPHNTASLARLSRPVRRDALQAGDLVFFNTLGRPDSHVGIYMGDGQFINAPSSGGQVRIDTMANPYFASRFNGAGSLFAP